MVSRVLGITRGLVLVTGPTGAGKSTTIASLLEQLNQQGLRRHIVTIEDPIEFVFEPKNAVFEQREVGTDTKSYARGLRGALRQMPNVIFVGEMRDLTSMAIALSAAETGNLVISTMATQSAAQTVTRIIDSFPPHQQSQVRSQLALTLRAVVAQVLLPRADGRGRVAAREVLFVNPAVANLIREDKIHQVPNAIATGGARGHDLARRLARRPGGPRHRHLRDRLPVLRGHREARRAAEALLPRGGHPRNGRTEGMT